MNILMKPLKQEKFDLKTKMETIPAKAKTMGLNKNMWESYQTISSGV